ncbi:MAG: cyclic nucleotide-binding domain-containing protein [Deltaproteobacteria bacterium]|nr:cyclic nucleotide-binding domain-containing protein [Deltaproteobacteria bacterium]
MSEEHQETPQDAPQDAPVESTETESANASREAVVEALGKIRVFDSISPEGLELLASIAREESYRGSDVIFKEGSTGGELYLILEGKVRISRDVSGMGEEALAVLGPGDAFGEMSLVDDFPRSADARVHERCRLLVLEKDAMEDLLFLEKDLAYEILWNFVKILSARLRETNDKMTFMSVTGKF